MTDSPYYSASETYLTGIPCTFCGVGADEPCRTSGDRPFADRCHSARRKDAGKQGVKLTEHKRERPQVENKPASKLKLALWYIETAGGIDNARRWIEVAADALANIDKGADSGRA